MPSETNCKKLSDPFRRICRTRTSTGTRLASFATGAEYPWWTNNLEARWIKFTVATVTTLSLLAVAMDAVKSSVLVRYFQHFDKKNNNNNIIELES